jgi:hypothetical protein
VIYCRVVALVAYRSMIFDVSREHPESFYYGVQNPRGELLGAVSSPCPSYVCYQNSPQSVLICLARWHTRNEELETLSCIFLWSPYPPDSPPTQSPSASVFDVSPSVVVSLPCSALYIAVAFQVVLNQSNVSVRASRDSLLRLRIILPDVYHCVFDVYSPVG